ncbi:MAG: LytTR family DNA-binding domain-containing protein [Cytophagales bacterium]|nr:LytTR family DNA-binding domain-containing protein [Bernardetiaceae bacterium]MDW8204509.1 LytTR family DNA-binding domain-containing protein [Cytophagales bacterium]
MNCIIVDDDAFSRTVIKQLVKRTANLEVLAECSSAIEAYQLLKNVEVDIIFLDVEMPEMSGLDLLRTLKKMPQIVVVTGNKDYAVEAFDYDVTDFLVKPVEYARFLRAVDRAESKLLHERKPVAPSLTQSLTNLSISSLAKQPQADTAPAAKGAQPIGGEDLFIKTKDDGRIVHLQIAEIEFIEALADYVEINTLSGERYVVHSTMKGMEKKLPESTFMRVHRSFIINTDCIRSIEDDKVVLLNREIPIGNSYRANFLSSLNILS